MYISGVKHTEAMFNSTSAAAVSKDLQEMAAKIAEKHGVIVSVGTLRYSSEEMRTSISVRAKLDQRPSLGGSLKPGPFLLNGKSVKVVDYVPRRSRYPYTVEEVGNPGRKFRVTREWYDRVSK